LVLEAPGLRAAPAVGSGVELKVLVHPQVVVHAEEVGHVTHDPVEVGPLPHDVTPGDLGPAFGRREQAGQDPQKSRLPGAVRADEPDARTPGHTQIQARQRVHLAEPVPDSLGRDGAHRSPPPGASGPAGATLNCRSGVRAVMPWAVNRKRRRPWSRRPSSCGASTRTLPEPRTTQPPVTASKASTVTRAPGSTSST